MRKLCMWLCLLLSSSLHATAPMPAVGSNINLQPVEIMRVQIEKDTAQCTAGYNEVLSRLGDANRAIAAFCSIDSNCKSLLHLNCSTISSEDSRPGGGVADATAHGASAPTDDSGVPVPQAAPRNGAQAGAAAAGTASADGKTTAAGGKSKGKETAATNSAGGAKPTATAANNPAASNQGVTATTTQASGDPSQDVRTCQSLMQTAIRVCTDPSASANDAVASAGGLNNYCQQMRDAGYNNGVQNNSAASTCIQKYGSCMSTCNAMASTYANQPALAQTLQGNANTCRSLASKVSEMTAQSTNSLNAASGGINCDQMAQAAPQSAPSADQAQAAANAVCSQNPNSVACQSAQVAANQASQGQASAAREQGTIGFETKTEAPVTFALPDQSGLPGTGFQGNGGAGANSEVPTVKTIANNSGGGIPGGGGSQPASLGGGNSSGGAQPGSPGYTTDISQGLRSGGGYTQPSGSNQQADSSSGFGGYGGGRVPSNDGSGYRNLDLKQYLPGGSRAPGGRTAAGMMGGANHIHGRFVDIWSRISERFQEKCRLGELLGCG